MPNHIQNKLQIIGDEQPVSNILSKISGKYDDGKDMQIDFRKILPMPKSLEITSDGYIMPIENPFCVNTEFKAHLDKMRIHLKDSGRENKQQTIDNFIQGIRNYLEYGHATWYGWSVENWGTKWNAYGQNDERNTHDTIYFETAWSTPIKVIKVLSEKFPSLKFILTYADEDSGSNTGEIVFVNGQELQTNKPDNQSIEAYGIYFELHPDRKQNYELVDGKYQCVEE